MIVRKTILTLMICALHLGVNAQVPIEHSSYKTSKISPKYFGPYAFPVPDLPESMDGPMHLAISFDSVDGTLAGKDAKDKTYAPTFEVSLPLWTDRASLNVWGEMHEWYTDTPQTKTLRRVAPNEPLKGSDSGSVYWSLNMLILKEQMFLPSIIIRGATQSATGDAYERARHYDAPGYFFDATIGKSLKTDRYGFIRPDLSIGFLCWQRDRGAQNDALMLAAQLSYIHKYFVAAISYAQYSGWEKDGDCPKVLKARINAHVGRFSPFVYIQHGLYDWPFTMVRFGVSTSFDLLHYRRLNFGSSE